MAEATRVFAFQRLRNLTTGKLHTQMADIYEDLEFFTRGGGIMTHMLPRVRKAIEPWLRERLVDKRFWDGKYDVSHVGEIELPQMSEAENMAALARYEAMPNPLFGKNVVVVEH